MEQSKIIENQLFKPVFYNLTSKNDEENFVKLLNNSSGIVVIDEIQSQLEELIKLRNPKLKLTPTEYQQKITEHLNGLGTNQYGIWIYYPWLNKVVHLLDEAEFIEVRTNRNQYKITPEEEDILATKTIGVIGLSVGKAIALTIAMERICGELIIADFDVIELSNLNRIQTGVQNFGLKKTIIVAREIAEIDPFLKVTCLHEGLTEKNMNKFFFPNDKKMDLCIEVCDGLSTKIFARQKAKEFGIPVVMDTNDNGMIDIERFDLDPKRPIFHGLIDHLDVSNIENAITNEEKLPFVASIIGIETISPRLKTSFAEVGKSITSWPQLASSVALGGGITCDVSRKILLNQLIISGRFFVNIDKIIKNN
ncbi:MAG: ThiF family adenylyltransferase [Bacteroidetes bacterium]|nr:ThiF family adenylyltransferase [Bacteroidota bacterium]